MSKKLKQLKEQLEEKVNRQAALLAIRSGKAEGIEKRDLNEDENAEFDQLESDIKSLKTKIEREQVFADAEKRNAEMHFADVRSTSEANDIAQAKQDFSITRAAQIANGTVKNDGIEREMLDEGAKIARESNLPTTGKGVIIPTFMLGEQRADTTTALAAGNAIPTILNGMRQGYAPKLFLDSLGVQRMNNLVGVNDIPVEDLIAVTGWVGETTSDSEIDPNIRKKTVSAKGIRSKIPASWALKANAGNASVDGMLERALLAGERNQVNKTLAKGGGSNEPTGLGADSDIPTIAIGTNGGAITRALIHKLKASPAKNDADFAESYGWLTTPGVQEFLENLKTDSGSGLFEWNENTPDRFKGFPAVTSTLVPSDTGKGTGTDLHTLIFGAFNQALVANWAVRELFVDKFSDDDKVWLKMVGFWDIAVLNPKAFAKIIDIDVS